MVYDAQKHHRRSIRLKGYDYTQPGAYFATICTYRRECLLGTVANGEMVLSQYGHLVETSWNAIPRHFSNIELDAFVVMPNHIHGIIIIGRGEAFSSTSRQEQTRNVRQSPYPAPSSERMLRPYRKPPHGKNQVPWGPSSKISNRFQRAKSIGGVTSTVFHSGNAIITNESSVMQTNWTAFAPISRTTPPNGKTTRTIP